MFLIFVSFFPNLRFSSFFWLFTFGQVKGNARDGRSRHQCFRVCEVDVATLKVTTTARVAGKIWTKMKLPFLSEVGQML